MSLAFLFHYLTLNVFRMLVHPSSGACVLLWIYFMCCIALVRCVSVLRRGSTGVVWYPYAGWSRAEQYNTWNKSTICRKLLKMDVLTFETCWALNNEIIKQVTSTWFNFIQLSRLKHSAWTCVEGIGVIAPLVLNLDTRWRGVINFPHWTRGLVAPGIRLDVLEDRGITFSPLRIYAWIVSSQIVRKNVWTVFLDLILHLRRLWFRTLFHRHSVDIATHYCIWTEFSLKEWKASCEKNVFY